MTVVVVCPECDGHGEFATRLPYVTEVCSACRGTGAAGFDMAAPPAVSNAPRVERSPFAPLGATSDSDAA